MAPDLWNTTSTSSPHWGYFAVSDRSFEVRHFTRNRFESYKYQGTTSPETFWSNHHKYDTSYTETSIYPSREAEKTVKKLLKMMADALCKEGWIDYKPYYFEPRSIPICLRGVRLEGRGWGNRK